MLASSTILRGGVSLALCTLVGACHGHAPSPRGAAPATVVAGPLPTGPDHPERGLPMPSLDVGWTPPMLTAGDLEALRAGFHDDPTVALQVGPRLRGPEWSARLEGLVRALQPHAERIQLVQRIAGAGPFAGVSLPLQRVPDEQSSRPRYDWDEGQLTPVQGAAAVLVLDDAKLEPSAWRALPAEAVGSCEAPLRALAEGQEQALAELEPFLDHADVVLWQVYRSALQTALPPLLERLRPYQAPRERVQGEDDDSWDLQQCGHASWQYLQAYAQCEDPAAPCTVAPRVFLMGGARIGAVEPSVYVPHGCDATLGLDVAAELRRVATESAVMALEHLDPAWVALADRLGTVSEVYEALEDVCTPRRRRYAPEDLQAMRQRLAAIGDTLASNELAHPGGGWSLDPAVVHVPGVGPVQQVAAYQPGPGSPADAVVAQARALRQFALQRALCHTGTPGLPLAAAVVDGASGTVEFFGYFFEEELFCGDLPPLWHESEAGGPDVPSPGLAQYARW